MKIRAVTVFAALFVAILSPNSEATESLVTLEFPAAEMAESDRRTMTRYRSSPVNLHCDFVRFDDDPLVTLISNLDSGTTTIDNSHILVRFPGGYSRKYVGISYEGAIQHGENGPFVWEGKVMGGGKYFASLIIQKENGTRAYVSTERGMYRLSPARQPGSYYLCLRDPEFRGKKID